MKRYLIFFLLLIFKFSFATHNKGGRIEADQIAPNTFNVKIYTYTKTSSIQSNRPYLDSVNWGDGSLPERFMRIVSIDIGGNVTLNTYTSQHTYSDTGFFKIHFEDPNREVDILNIPNSVSVPMYIESEIHVDPNNCPYNSAHLLSIPIFNFPIGKDFILSRAAYDPNWDSLSYELDTCLGLGGHPIGGYLIPAGISLNPISGEFKWLGDSMNVLGNYSFSIKTKKWRHGIYMGYVKEDFPVSLENSDTLFDFNTASYPINFSSTILPGISFNLYVEYFDPTTPSVYFCSEYISGSNFTDTIVGNVFTGNFSWTPSMQASRTTPYLLQFRGRKDLTYLLYVDGTPVDTCRRTLIRVDEINSENNDATVFPNPTNNQFQIKIDGITAEKINISLLDLSGKIIFEKTSSAEDLIDVSKVSSGMYILKIESKNKIYYRKVLKN